MVNWNVMLSVLLLTFSLFSQTFSIEPISTGIAISFGVGLLGLKREKILEYTLCLVAECCDDRSIPRNFTKLTQDLQNHLFGQHIVTEQVIQALRSHYDHIDTSRKPLVMSFHGTPGTGKNYVADFIAKSIYANGLDSKFVHRFSGKLDFPNEAEFVRYSIALRDLIKDAIKICPKSLFIFDEVDDMPPGVFDTITSLLDHHETVNKLNFRQAIFIFLSNTGGVEIAETAYNHYTNDKINREALKLYHFEQILELSAYNRDGGLKKSRPIEAGLIDHYIPFLPLEKEHVIACIKVEFERLGIPLTEKRKTEMLKFVTFEGLFAKNGCKRISKKAELFLNVPHKK